MVGYQSLTSGVCLSGAGPAVGPGPGAGGQPAGGAGGPVEECAEGPGPQQGGPALHRGQVQLCHVQVLQHLRGEACGAPPPPGGEARHHNNTDAKDDGRCNTSRRNDKAFTNNFDRENITFTETIFTYIQYE